MFCTSNVASVGISNPNLCHNTLLWWYFHNDVLAEG